MPEEKVKQSATNPIYEGGDSPQIYETIDEMKQHSLMSASSKDIRYVRHSVPSTLGRNSSCEENMSPTTELKDSPKGTDDCYTVMKPAQRVVANIPHDVKQDI